MLLPSVLAAATIFAGGCNARGGLLAKGFRAQSSNSVAAAEGCQNVQPKGFICGDTGYLKSPSAETRNSNLVSDLESCTNGCLLDPKCVTFSFQQGKSCNFYSKSAKAMDFNSSRSNKDRYYSRSCFAGSCPPFPQTTCPAKARSGSLLQAGDFENDSWGCWKLDPSFTTKDSTYGLVTPGFNSNFGGQLYLSSNNKDTAVQLVQSVKGLVAGQPYTISLNTKMVDPQCDLVVTSTLAQPFALGQFFPGEYVPLGPKSQDWETYEQVLVPYTDETWSFYIFADCYGNYHNSSETSISYFVDNIRLAKRGSKQFTPSTEPTGPNMVMDGNLTSKSLDHFQIVRNPDPNNHVPVTVRYNKKFQAIEATVSKANGGTIINIGQELATVKDDMYLLSVDVMYAKNVGEPDYSTCSSAFFLYNPPYRNGHYLSDDVGTGNNPVKEPGVWATITGVGSAMTNSDSINVQAYCNTNTTGSATFYYRNFQAYPLGSAM